MEKPPSKERGTEADDLDGCFYNLTYLSSLCVPSAVYLLFSLPLPSKPLTLQRHSSTMKATIECLSWLIDTV